jgi:hypothetical protein
VIHPLENMGVVIYVIRRRISEEQRAESDPTHPPLSKGRSKEGLRRVRRASSLELRRKNHEKAPEH